MGTLYSRGLAAGGWLWSGGNACWGPGPGPLTLFTGASIWPLGPGSSQWREQLDCKMQVSVSCGLPVSPRPPLCPVVLRPQPTVSFLRGWSLFCCWSIPGAPVLGYPGLTLAQVSLPPSRAAPCDFGLVGSPAVVLEVRLPNMLHSHLCLRAWGCSFSGDSAFPPQDKPPGSLVSQGVGHAAKPLMSQ